MTQIHWSLPENLLSESIAIMRPHGVTGNEGLALWFGKADGARVEVTHVIEVFGPGFKTTPLYMSLSLRAMSVLTDLAEQLDAFLVGQIHSHPGRLLDLSELDQRSGIRSQDYLSVVCPFYAQHQVDGFRECGVHVFEGRQYRRLPIDEVSRRLLVQPRLVKKIRCEVPA
jgi:proteasome lid subunit RPN8/RPN11